MEPDPQEKLQHLKESLKRIKALLAWEQLKCSETKQGRTILFQMRDSPDEDLRNEYDFFVNSSLALHSILKDQSTILTEAAKDTIWQQLAEVEGQVYWLELHRRFAGPGGWT